MRASSVFFPRRCWSPPRVESSMAPWVEGPPKAIVACAKCSCGPACEAKQTGQRAVSRKQRRPEKWVVVCVVHYALPEPSWRVPILAVRYLRRGDATDNSSTCLFPPPRFGTPCQASERVRFPPTYDTTPFASPTCFTSSNAGPCLSSPPSFTHTPACRSKESTRGGFGIRGRRARGHNSRPIHRSVHEGMV